MTAPRKTTIEVTWQGKDISRDIAPDLLSISYADNLSGAADDLTIDIQDRAGLWSGPWRPQMGDTVVARIKAEPWFTQVDDLRLGTFAHDKITIAGPPKTVHLSCVSVPLSTGIRRRKRTRGWSGVTLKQIAEDIADKASLTLDWSGAAGFTYKRRQQTDKSNLEFLEELCKEVGRDVKVTEGKIAVFDALSLDATPSTGAISLIKGHVESWSFDSDDSSRYGSCAISVFDPRDGKVKRAEYPPPGVSVPGLDPDGQSLEVRMSIDTKGQGATKAQALLRNANRFATSGKLTVQGDPGLVAGVTFDLTDAFGFDGKFIITRAEHDTSGFYTCRLNVRRCLEY